MASSMEIETDKAGGGTGASTPSDVTIRRLRQGSIEGQSLARRSETAELDVKTPAPEDRKAEAPPAASPVPTSETSARAREAFRRRMLFALLPAALLIGGYFYVTGGAIMSTDNAYVQADSVGISTDVVGMVSEVLVKDNQKVAKGDVLFKLDDLPFKLALDRANAQLAITKNDLLALRASYKNMEAQIEQAKTDVTFNTVNFERQKKLAATNFTPEATLDAFRNTLQASQRKLTSLEQQLAGIAASLNGNADAPIEDHPRYKDALAARDEAARKLSHTVVRAPFAGIVTNVPSLQPGQYFAEGTTAFNIVSTDHVWVEASPKETALTYVKPGQKVTVEVDTYPGVEWTGAVESISPASASSFSLLPAQNSSGNWVKVVQRVPMRVRVDNTEGKPHLRVGMSVELSVDTGHPRGFPSFITKLFATPGEHRG